MQGYNTIDQRIHQLCQIITKVNRTFVPSQPDDSHTNLYFDSIEHKVYGRWVDTGNGNKILALNLQSLTLEWINDTLQVIQSHTVQNKTYHEIEQSIADALPEIGLGEKNFKEKLHFEISVYPFINDPFTRFVAQDLSQWQHYRAIANHASFKLLGMLQVECEIRIWPHHFDTGIYVEPTKQLGLGFGLAMEDRMVGSPYFYFSANGLNDHIIDYSSISEPTSGQWIINDSWKGAVLPLSDLQEAGPDTINGFLREATNWFLRT
jgi:hypothetical protein